MSIHSELVDHSEHLMTSTIVVRPMTVQEEFERVVGDLRDIHWFRERGLVPLLPHDYFFNDHLRFQRLQQTGVALQYFKDRIYGPLSNFYSAWTMEVQAVLPEATNTLGRLPLLKQNWGFVLFPSYEVLITRFGMLGSYEEKTGQVIIRGTNRDRRYPLLRTMIHEIVHIGIEHLILQHNLTHEEKERIVDLICINYLGDFLPDYWENPNTDRRVDPFVTYEDIVDNLPAAIERYMIAFPRPQKGSA